MLAEDSQANLLSGDTRRHRALLESSPTTRSAIDNPVDGLSLPKRWRVHD